MKYLMHNSYEFLLTHINILSLYARHWSWLLEPGLTPGLMLVESDWEGWGAKEKGFHGPFPLASLPHSYHHHLPVSQKMRGN